MYAIYGNYVSIYASTMDPMGHGQLLFFGVSKIAQKIREKNGKIGWIIG